MASMRDELLSLRAALEASHAQRAADAAALEGQVKVNQRLHARMELAKVEAAKAYEARSHAVGGAVVGRWGRDPRV